MKRIKVLAVVWKFLAKVRLILETKYVRGGRNRRYLKWNHGGYNPVTMEELGVVDQRQQGGNSPCLYATAVPNDTINSRHPSIPLMRDDQLGTPGEALHAFGGGGGFNAESNSCPFDLAAD